MIRWREWGAAAFERARAEGRPVLLSLTARWCGACHRMDEETWGDPGVAAAVERAAEPVRVDADARPDVYARYHLGGLPTTVLLDAAGRFVRGATYLSRPALFAFLEQALADHRAGRTAPPRPALPPRREAGALVADTVAWLLRRADREHGGLGWAPKLPEPEALTLLLRRWRAGRDLALEQVVRRALDAIDARLADPRDGGFFRYAAAPDWSAPHTEKLAVDQGRLARLFLEAGVALGEPRYTAAATRALDHARRRLVDGDGYALASVAADPEYYADGGEPPPVDPRRFADAAASLAAAGWLAHAVTGAPPIGRDAAGPETEGLETAAPETIGPETTDPGDAARGPSAAAGSPGAPAGGRRELLDLLVAAGPDGVVPHRLDEPAGVGGLLADQAAALSAALLRHALTGDEGTLVWARRVADRTIALLWDDAEGAFRAGPGDAGLDLPAMFPAVANAEVGIALAGLAELTGAPYRAHAQRLLAALAPRAVGSPARPALALLAERLGAPSPEVAIEGAPDDPRAAALARVAVAALGPQTVVRWGLSAEPAATVCAGELCLPPIADAGELAEALADLDLVPRGILGR